MPEGRRSLLREYNPCWCLTPGPAQGPPVVWTGFQDGSIRCFEYVASEAGKLVWREGAGSSEIAGASQVRRPALKVSASVQALRIVAGRLLAYGTGDGTIGVVDLADLEPSDRSSPPCHLLHTREESRICGLLEDEAHGRLYLLALTENGVACLFFLKRVGTNPEADEPRSLEKREAGRGEEHPKPWLEFPGVRLDLGLEVTARGLAPVVRAGGLLRFVVGSSTAPCIKSAWSILRAVPIAAKPSLISRN